MLLKKLLIVLLLSIIISIPLLGATPYKALPNNPEPLESIGDCTTYANNPVKASYSVTGTGGVSCLFTHPKMNVVVTVYDVSAGVRSSQGTKSCTNQSSCSTTSGTVSFVSGHYYRTEVSVYFTNSNQYAQSSDIQLY